jgi:hypothetical protein
MHRRWVQRPWARWLLVLALLPAAPLAADEAAPDLEAFARRLTEPAGLWLTLWEIGEAGPAAAPLVPAVAQHLARGHEVTRRLAAEALGRIGASDPIAERALVEALRGARGLLEETVLRALVDLGAGVPFRGELPEAITFASTPALRALEAAYTQKIVLADEVAWLEACRVEALAHAQRLQDDRIFRLGEQVKANVAASAAGAPGLEVTTHWSAPFLLVGVRPRRPASTQGDPGPAVRSLRALAAPDPNVEAGLAAAAEVCQGVYRAVLAAHGEELGLKPLEDPFGGRSDLKLQRRSYAEGFPMQIWCVERGLRAFGGMGVVPQRDPERPVVIVEPATQGRWGAEAGPRVGSATARALRLAFTRQHAGWRHPRNPFDAWWAVSAVVDLWGSARRDTTGAMAFATEPPMLAAWRARVHARESQGPKASGADLFPPLARLLELRRSTEAMEWALAEGIDPSVGVVLFAAQATGFACFLRDHADPARRACWPALLKLVLADASEPETQRRALGLPDAEDLEALEAEFRAWWRAGLGLAAPDAPPRPPEAPDAPR